MSRFELTPEQALQSCLDVLLSDIQAQLLLPADRLADNLKPPGTETLARSFSRLAAASLFLAHSRSALLCKDLCRDWQMLQSKTGVSRDRQILLDLGRCRESWQTRTADDVLRHLLLDQVGAAIDTLAADPEGKTPEQCWLPETLAGCRALINAGYFLTDVGRYCRSQPPRTARPRLRWLLMLQGALETSPEKRSVEPSEEPPEEPPEESPALHDSVPRVFRRELVRCLQNCHASTADVVCQYLWQLQLLAGALLALGSMQRRGQAMDSLKRHCHGLMLSSTQARLQRSGDGKADQLPLREVMRHALALYTGLAPARAASAGTDAPKTGIDLALVALPDTVSAPMQALLAASADRTSASVDWAVVSLRVYRVLVYLRLLGGGFVDAEVCRRRQSGLSRWQILMASLHTSVDHCLQRSVVTTEDQSKLLVLLHRVTLKLEPECRVDDAELLPDTLLTAARLNLRAQRHWQRLTLDLDAAQQDFAGVSAQQVLAKELHCLPRMGGAARRPPPVSVGELPEGGLPGGVLPQDVLRDLRLLLKGSRILNVPRIESLVLVMIEVYTEMLAYPVFAEESDIDKALLRAHRSLCRMLDQAAAWQTPGNARRMINTLYGCLERWRGGRRVVITTGPADVSASPAVVVESPAVVMESPAVGMESPAVVMESPAGQANDPWQRCLIINRRLRKLLRHHDDLDSIRALLLELLRSQEEIMRRQADNGAVPDALQG